MFVVKRFAFAVAGLVVLVAIVGCGGSGVNVANTSRFWWGYPSNAVLTLSHSSSWNLSVIDTDKLATVTIEYFSLSGDEVNLTGWVERHHFYFGGLKAPSGDLKWTDPQTGINYTERFFTLSGDAPESYTFNLAYDPTTLSYTNITIKDFKVSYLNLDSVWTITPNGPSLKMIFPSDESTNQTSSSSINGVSGNGKKNGKK